MYEIITESLFFLILINPVSKIVLINMMPNKIKKDEIKKLLIKSSFIAYVLLVIFAFGGTFILNDVFQIDINALRLAGGVVLGIMGFRALDKGLFFNLKTQKSLLNMAVIPLASPFIAGPATITATILKSTVYSPIFISGVLIISVAANAVISWCSLSIKNVLDKYNLMGALIRITGLFIMSMGFHMILVATKSFLF